MSLNLATLLRASAQRVPDKPAIISGDTQLTYRAVHDAARRFAGALADLGVHPGQHVALMLPNVPEFTMAYFGGHYAGAPIVPLNVLLKGPEVAYHLDDSDAVALVVWEGFLDEALAGFNHADMCRHLIVAKADSKDYDTPPGTLSWSALLRDNDPIAELPRTMPDDTAVVLYTSGTTGRPKGAELTHFNLFYNADYCRTKLIPLDPDTVALATLPLFHSFGQTCVQNATLAHGGTVVLLARFEPTAAFEALERHRVTYFAGVPTMYFALLNHPEADRYDVSSLKYCVCGGSAMPVEVMKAFDEKYGVNILEGYGLSETSPVASFNVLNRPKKIGSIGIPIEGVEFKLIDTDERTVKAANQPGEICITGHNVMKGYYQRPEVNEEVFRGGWFHTGDIAIRDDDGYYFIVDRKKDMVIRGGYNVYPREIEEVLYGHPAVAEAAVVGVPHESHGEEVKAIIAFKAGTTASPEEIIAYCKERLAAYKYPRLVEFRDELPKGPTGKILKRELRS